MKKGLLIWAIIVFFSFASSMAFAGTVNGTTFNAYGVHDATITVSDGGTTVSANAGSDLTYHWNKSNWSTRTGQKAFYSTSEFNGKKVSYITDLSWDLDAGYWGNAYFNVMVEDAGGYKAILAPSYNDATSEGWDTTVGSSTKSYAVFEAEAGWTGTVSTGWYAATWDEVKNLTITNGPFTEFPDTLIGAATMQDDPVYTVANWSAWADQAAGYDADWEKGGFLITFGQSTGGSPAVTTISNINVSAGSVRIMDTGIEYSTLQAAYDAAIDGDTIQSQGITFVEELFIDDLSNKSVTLQAGYNNDYSAITGITSLNGDMTISNGIVTIESGIFEVL